MQRAPKEALCFLSVQAVFFVFVFAHETFVNIYVKKKLNIVYIESSCMLTLRIISKPFLLACVICWYTAHFIRLHTQATVGAYGNQ